MFLLCSVYSHRPTPIALFQPTLARICASLFLSLSLSPGFPGWPVSLRPVFSFDSRFRHAWISRARSRQKTIYPAAKGLDSFLPSIRNFPIQRFFSSPGGEFRPRYFFAARASCPFVNVRKKKEERKGGKGGRRGRGNKMDGTAKARHGKAVESAALYA